jgi:DNA-binding NtrC family response regulator
VGSASKQVLVVEDQEIIRFVLEEILTDAGYEVMTAECGDMAIEMLADLTPDYLVTDIQMPGTADGNAVGAAARMMYPNLAIIYMTGRPDLVTATLGTRSRMLQKPFSSGGLLKILSQWTDGSGKANDFDAVVEKLRDAEKAMQAEEAWVNPCPLLEPE